MALFTRLTFNENEWIIPSGHPWDERRQGNANTAYENQNGFGHEEWLFNVRYNVDGWQYGYIRGLSRVHDNIDRVYLYTVKKEANQRHVYYLGYLNNVEVLPPNWRETLPEVEQAFLNSFPSTIEEIEQINGNTQALDVDPLVPVFRFRIQGNGILDTPHLLNNFPLNRYKRFQPYQITDEILAIFQNEEIVADQAPFSFIVGKASQTERFNRYISTSSRAVIRTHSKIIDALEVYLSEEYSLVRENLSIERTRFQGNIADLVTLEEDGAISIYEVKTSLNLRKNIREAIAQLLDYASHSNNTTINKLVIVSPCELNEEGCYYLESLSAIIQYRIIYMQYAENGQTRFVMHEQGVLVY